jgi:large subunit ribosomal protein L17
MLSLLSLTRGVGASLLAAPALLSRQQRGLMTLRKRHGRPKQHRWDMLRNMLDSLFEHERIKTTQAKAWELRRVADRVVTFGKKGTTRARYQAAKYLRMNHNLTKLFTSALAPKRAPALDRMRPARDAPCTQRALARARAVFADRYRDRSGGYTRMLKTYPRIGDGAPMAYIEMVDRPAMKRQPLPLAEQPNSVWPGRGGRKWRASKRDLRNETRVDGDRRRWPVGEFYDPGSASPGPPGIHGLR